MITYHANIRNDYAQQHYRKSVCVVGSYLFGPELLYDAVHHPRDGYRRKLRILRDVLEHVHSSEVDEVNKICRVRFGGHALEDLVNESTAD